MPAIRFDYNSVLERLKKRLLNKLDGQSLLLFSTNSAILEAAAEEFDDLAMYDEFLTRECVWDTAQGNSSIMKQVAFFNYKPHRKIGAQGVITLSPSPTFDGGWANWITIPAFTQISGRGVTFLTKESSGAVPPGTACIRVPVVQGEKAIFSVYIEKGSFTEYKSVSYVQIKIEDDSIENTLYEVRVNGEVWKEIADIRLAAREKEPGKAKVYAIDTLPKYAGVVLRFGDDSLGMSLKAGDNVKFIYARTSGTEGDVLASGAITSVDDTIKDEKGNKVKLYCRNDTAVLGGQDCETLESIKLNAPLSFGIADRAITANDYTSLILSKGIIDKCCVWGEKEINEDAGNPPGTYIPASENLVYITGYSINDNIGTPITESQETEIREFLNDKKGMTDILQFVKTQIIYVNFKPKVFISDSAYTNSQVVEMVHDALSSQYSIQSAVYRKGLYYSDYIAVIDNVKGVDHCLCSVSYSVIIGFEIAYGFNTVLDLRGIKPKSVSVKIQNTSLLDSTWKEVARDNGKGDFEGCPIDTTDPNSKKFDVSGAKISYLSGAIDSFVIGEGIDGYFRNYRIRIDFELDDTAGGDLKLTKRQQLFTYYSDTTEIERMV